MGREVSSHETIVSEADNLGASLEETDTGGRAKMDVRARTEQGVATGVYVVTTDSVDQFEIDTDDSECECGESPTCEHVRQVQRALEYTDLASPGERVTGFDHSDISGETPDDQTQAQRQIAQEIRGQEQMGSEGTTKYEYHAKIPGFGTATGWRHAQSAAVVRDKIRQEQVGMYGEVEESEIEVTVKAC